MLKFGDRDMKKVTISEAIDVFLSMLHHVFKVKSILIVVSDERGFAMHSAFDQDDTEKILRSFIENIEEHKGACEMS
jgi:hypothetical protein